MSVPTGSSSFVRRRGAALVLALGVGLLSACGGGNDDSSDTAATTAADTSSSPAATSSSATETTTAGSGEAQEVAVTEQNFRIMLPSTDLSAGDYTFTIRNADQMPHDLSIELNGQTITKSDVIQPGQSGTLEVSLEPGSYIFYCSVGRHRANGMQVGVNVS